MRREKFLPTASRCTILIHGVFMLFMRYETQVFADPPVECSNIENLTDCKKRHILVTTKPDATEKAMLLDKSIMPHSTPLQHNSLSETGFKSAIFLPPHYEVVSFKPIGYGSDNGLVYGIQIERIPLRSRRSLTKKVSIKNALLNKAHFLDKESHISLRSRSKLELLSFQSAIQKRPELKDLNAGINGCFLETAICVLANDKEFLNTLLTSYRSLLERNAKKTDVHKALIRVLTSAITNSSKTTKIDRKIFVKKSKQSSQEDLDDTICQIYDRLNSESKDFFKENQFKIKRTFKSKRNQNRFLGSSSVSCKPIPLVPSSHKLRRVPVEDCIIAALKDQIKPLISTLSPEKCEDKILQGRLIQEFPKTLSFTLNRGFTKTLSPEIPKCFTLIDKQYRLKTLVIHRGQHYNSGHYYCILVNLNGTGRKVNTTAPTHLDEDHINDFLTGKGLNNERVYSAIYEKMNESIL